MEFWDFTFGFLSLFLIVCGSVQVVDPTYQEEAVLGGRMTTTVNSNGDVCAIQKAGGEGVMPSEIMRCLRVATVKAAEITQIIKESVSTSPISSSLYGFPFLLPILRSYTSYLRR